MRNLLSALVFTIAVAAVSHAQQHCPECGGVIICPDCGGTIIDGHHVHSAPVEYAQPVYSAPVVVQPAYSQPAYQGVAGQSVSADQAHAQRKADLMASLRSRPNRRSAHPGEKFQGGFEGIGYAWGGQRAGTCRPEEYGSPHRRLVGDATSYDAQGVQYRCRVWR